MSLEVYSLHIIVHVNFTATRTTTSYKCISKQNTWPKAQFFSYLSMVSSWSYFSMSLDFLKTMKLQIMKKISKQNTKKGSTVQYRIECMLRMFMLQVKRKQIFVRVFVLIYCFCISFVFNRLNNRIMSLNSVNDSHCTSPFLISLFTQSTFSFA